MYIIYILEFLCKYVKLMFSLSITFISNILFFPQPLLPYIFLILFFQFIFPLKKMYISKKEKKEKHFLITICSKCSRNAHFVDLINFALPSLPLTKQMGGLTKNPLAGLAALGALGMAPANTGGLNPTGNKTLHQFYKLSFHLENYRVISTIIFKQVSENRIRKAFCLKFTRVHS